MRLLHYDVFDVLTALLAEMQRQGVHAEELKIVQSVAGQAALDLSAIRSEHWNEADRRMTSEDLHDFARRFGSAARADGSFTESQLEGIETTLTDIISRALSERDDGATPPVT